MLFLARHRVDWGAVFGVESIGNASPFELDMFLFLVSYADPRSSDFPPS